MSKFQSVLISTILYFQLSSLNSLAQKNVEPCYCHIYISYDNHENSTSTFVNRGIFVNTEIMPWGECNHKIEGIQPRTIGVAKQYGVYNRNRSNNFPKYQYLKRSRLVVTHIQTDKIQKELKLTSTSMQTALNNALSELFESNIVFEQRMKNELLNGLETLPNDIATEEAVELMKQKLLAQLKEYIDMQLAETTNQ